MYVYVYFGLCREKVDIESQDVTNFVSSRVNDEMVKIIFKLYNDGDVLSDKEIIAYARGFALGVMVTQLLKERE